MKLKSFGCSFTYGSDLHDCKKYLEENNKTVPSQYTWPALLANEFDMSYECFASPGAGNFKTLDDAVKYRDELKSKGYNGFIARYKAGVRIN